MAFTVVINGTILDTMANPVVGMTVKMYGSGLVDTDVTDINGQYSVSESRASSGGDPVHVDPSALSPHWNDPGIGPSHAFGSGGTFTDNFTATLVNQNPTVGSMSARSFQEVSGIYTGDFSMADADGDTLTPEKVSGESWGTVSKVGPSTGRWTWQTNDAVPGVFLFSYRALDPYNGVSTTRTVQVTITEENQPPELDPPGNQSYLNKSGVHTVQLVASDPESDAITYSKVSGPAWVTVASSTGIVSHNTNSATRGVHAVTVRATATGGSSDESYNVTITNNPPVIVTIPNVQYSTNSGTKTEPTSANDADGDPRTWSKVSGDSWGSISSSTGLRTFVLTGVAAGTYNFTWQVSDGQGGTDQKSHSVTLIDPVPSPMFQMIG